MKFSKKAILKILDNASVTLNGDNPWDIQIHDEKFYTRVLFGGSLALGETYMDGLWDVERIDLFVDKLLRSGVSSRRLSLTTVTQWFKARLYNMQSLIKARKVIDVHYDIGNELYMSFLDPNNQYSCGYFNGTNNLNEAQEKKMDLICRKLQLKSTDKVLDIGCGWGGLAKYIAEKYGCSVVGISISNEQIKYARENTKGLSVEIKHLDYRHLEGSFDKIISVGMFEHVGRKNHSEFFKIIDKILKPEGLFLLHTIGGNISTTYTDPWIDKYIFPNGVLPSIQCIGKASEKLLTMEDWHNFGHYYSETLLAWEANFVKAWPKLQHKYSPTFYRMWRYYLLVCAGGFKARHMHLWQIVFSKGDLDEVYKSVR